MGVTKEQKTLYNDRVKAYKQGLDDIKKEVAMVKGFTKNPALQPYAQIRIAIESLKSAGIYAQMWALQQLEDSDNALADDQAGAIQ